MPGLLLPAGSPFPFGPTAAGIQLGGGGFVLTGFSLEETTLAAPARVVFRDGPGPGGLYIMGVTLGAGESRAEDAPGRYVMVESGLYVDVTAGTVMGSLFAIPVNQVVRGGGLVTIGQGRMGSFDLVESTTGDQSSYLAEV